MSEKSNSRPVVSLQALSPEQVKAVLEIVEDVFFSIVQLTDVMTGTKEAPLDVCGGVLGALYDHALEGVLPWRLEEMGIRTR